MVDKVNMEPNDQVDLSLGSKGFFTTIFASLEDIESELFNDDSYLFKWTGLHLRLWMEKFRPQKEYFLVALGWIQLYFLH